MALPFYVSYNSQSSASADATHARLVGVTKYGLLPANLSIQKILKLFRLQVAFGYL
jgi:hypothetical protein